MAPSPNSDKKGLVEGLQVITSALLSPQNPQETSSMKLGFLKRKLTSKSSPRSSQPSSPATSTHPMYPADSKTDYDYGLDKSSPPTSKGSFQGFSKAKHDAPPPYFQPQQSTSDSKGPTLPVDSKPSVSNAKPDLKDFKGENLLRVLEHYEIVVILDDSYTMLIPSLTCGKNRWDQAWDALETLVDHASRYTRSPIEIHFLNRRSADTTVRNVHDLRRVRQTTPLPERDTYTPLGDVLDTLLLKYMKITGDNPHTSTAKKRDFLVITDGEATDDPVPVIVQAAKFYQRNHFPLGQVGIQFVQVGDDEEATKFLQSLDEDLAEEMGNDHRDIVDTIKSNGRDLEGTDLIKALTGGFNRKLDKVGELR